MTREERAVELHKAGFNCAQSVLCALCDLTGLEEDAAKAVAGGFGGGLRCGEVCGALAGAVMALGICCPYTKEGDTETKERIAALTKEFTGEFEDQFENLRCDDLVEACGGKECCNDYIAWCVQNAADYIA